MRKKPVRESIIRTAARLFYQNGYSNTGINQIIKEAGIAKSSLYQHFRSKEDLFMAYLEETGVMTLGLLKQAAEKRTTPKEKVLEIFDYLNTLVGRDDFFGCHFLNIVYEMPQEASRIKVQVRKQKDGVRELFKQILADNNAETLADEIYTLFEGALISNKVHDQTWPIISARNIVEKLL